MSYNKKKHKLTKTRWGFNQYKPAPSENELKKYYERKYYQKGCGGYEVSYNKEELEYNKLNAWMIYRETEKLISKKNGAIIDLGCGEGFLLNEFYNHGWLIKGIDFSKHGIEKLHPHLLPFFERGNISNIMRKESTKKKYDVILLGNVIEHVIDPVAMLNDIKLLMHKHSILIIVVPNDFSELHNHLLKEKYITKEWWLDYPEHLSYFNKSSMNNLVQDLGFCVRAIVAGNPIDLNLLNDNSNYIKHKSKGKNTHIFRMRMNSFMSGVDREKMLHLYEVLGSMGIGRTLAYYCSLA